MYNVLFPILFSCFLSCGGGWKTRKKNRSWREAFSLCLFTFNPPFASPSCMFAHRACLPYMKVDNTFKKYVCSPYSGFHFTSPHFLQVFFLLWFFSPLYPVARFLYGLNNKSSFYSHDLTKYVLSFMFFFPTLYINSWRNCYIFFVRFKTP